MLQTITPASRAHWTAQLARLAQQPLRLCPDFPSIAARWEAWWRFDAPRPLVIASAPKVAGIRRDKAFDLLDRPDEWLRVRRAQVEGTHYAGDTIPSVRVDLGPVVTAAFVGAPLHFAPAEQTSWQDPIIRDWDTPPDLRLRPDNRWLQMVLTLARATAADAAGSYAVCLPDLTGAVDALANLRGGEQLCLDLTEHRAAVIAAAERLLPVWEHAFAALHETIVGGGCVITQWLGCFSLTPYTIPTCDFNYLIGPRDFADVCLPSLRAQARRAGRCCFHLDGPGASRHAEALARDPAITAIQYTPGAGTPSALAKLPMLKLVQSLGKPLLVICPRAEVEPLLDALDPRGLVLWPEGIATPQQADAVAALVARRGG